MKYIPVGAVILFLAVGGFLIWNNSQAPVGMSNVQPSSQPVTEESLATEIVNLENESSLQKIAGFYHPDAASIAVVADLPRSYSGVGGDVAYFKDANSVYVVTDQGEWGRTFAKIIGADPKTFKVINAVRSSDAHNQYVLVYYAKEGTDTSYFSVQKE